LQPRSFDTVPQCLCDSLDGRIRTVQTGWFNAHTTPNGSRSWP